MNDFKSTRMLILTMYAILMLLIGVQSQAAQSQPDPSPRETEQPAEVDQLEQHLEKAQDDLRLKNTADAATELEKAAALLETQESRLGSDAKQRLDASAQELKQLARQLKGGTVVPQKKIRQVFARAHHAMAQNYQQKASESRDQNIPPDLSKDIAAAADHLEKAWHWSGRKLEAAADAVIKNSKQLAAKIGSGAASAVEEAAGSIDDLGHEIAAFWTELTAANPPSVTFAANQKDAGSKKKANDPGIDLTTAIIQVAEKKLPTVVHITVTERQKVPHPILPHEKSSFFQRYFSLSQEIPKQLEREIVGVGSGIIIDSQGYILTNNHVVAGASKIQVRLFDGRTYSAEVVGTDPKTDLGVIQISADNSLPYAIFGDSDQVEVGQWVVAIGQPENLSESVSQGVISAKHRTGINDPGDYQDFLQTDAPINPGNSGGPLMNLHGNVIGINSAIFSTSGGFQGIGFAIPSNMAAHVADALMKNGKVERGWLGVSLQQLTPKLAQSFGLNTSQGAAVTQVVKGGPADEAGIKVGDVITQLQGKPIPDAARLRNAIADTKVGKEVDLTILRNGKTQQIKVKIGNLEEMNKKLAAALKERLGILVKPIPDLEASAYKLPPTGGVMIDWVNPNGPLGKKGFEVDDIILAVNGHPAADVETFSNLVDSLAHGKKIVLVIRDYRTGQVGSVQVTEG